MSLFHCIALTAQYCSRRLSKLENKFLGGSIFTLKYVQVNLHVQKAHNMYN